MRQARPAWGEGRGGGFFWGGGHGGGLFCRLLLAFDRRGDIATADRAARAAPLDGRQVDAFGFCQQLGALRHLDRRGDLPTIWRRRLHGLRGLDRRRLGNRRRGWSFLGRRVSVRADGNFSQRRTYRNGLSRLGEDLHQGAARGRGHLGIHLVGGDLTQAFAFANLVAGLLEPLGDGPLGDRLTHLRKGDLHGRLGHGGILPTKLGSEYDV